MSATTTGWARSTEIEPLLDPTQPRSASSAYIGCIMSEPTLLNDGAIPYRQKRRDFKTSVLVSLALRIQRERGTRAAGRFLIAWNVHCWVSARVLFEPNHVRRSDKVDFPKA